MIAFRDKTVKEFGLDLIVHVNEDGIARGINPIDHAPSIHTDVLKTQALKQALDRYGFDAAFGGARRDEEASRAKERVFSFRASGHRWDPRKQRPEMWRLLNGRLGTGETVRIFPLSNWTEKTSGATSCARSSTSCRSTSPPNARPSCATASC